MKEVWQVSIVWGWNSFRFPFVYWIWHLSIKGRPLEHAKSLQLTYTERPWTEDSWRFSEEKCARSYFLLLSLQLLQVWNKINLIHFSYFVSNLSCITPLSQCPGGTFSLSGDKNLYRNPDGNRKSIVYSSKTLVGIVLEWNFFIFNFQWG